VAFVVGLGLPLLIAWLATRYAAKIPGRALWAGLIPVEVRDGQVTREGRPFRFTRDDTQLVDMESRGMRNLILPGGITAQVRTGPGIGAIGSVELDGGPGRDTLSESDLRSLRRAPGRGRGPDQLRRTRLPLDIHDRWVAVVDRRPLPGRTLGFWS
jgi:hypothetical protein